MFYDVNEVETVNLWCVCFKLYLLIPENKMI